jgi:pimeloyl-ACP methyl ester carboxylesterase
MRRPVIPMVLIHGSGHTHESFDAQVAAFGCDAVSLPGHPEGEALASIGDSAAWLAKYLRWKGTDRAIVGGNSLGGAIAIEFALRYPERTAGLLLVGTGARLKVAPTIFEMIDSRWPDCIDDLVGFSLAAAADPSLRAQVRAWHELVGPRSTRRDYENCDEFDAMGRVASIRARTLIVVGAEDKMTPQKYSAYLHDKIAGSELAVIDGAGHMAHAEKPGAVNEQITAVFSDSVA